MTLSIQILASPGGMLAAVACVVVGGPWFADGLRALRLRRMLATLRERPLHQAGEGLVQVRGRVALESPLFAPLSAKPCAGFVLEARGVGLAGHGEVHELRPFRLVSPDGEARVEPERGDWRLAVTAERTVAAGEGLSANLAALFERHEALLWLRDRGAAMHVTERALLADAPACVIGYARSRALEAGPVRLARTGTDGTAQIEVEVTPTCETTIESGDALDLLVVNEAPASAAGLAPPRWRVAGALLGPALALSGLCYLAWALDASLAKGLMP